MVEAAAAGGAGFQFNSGTYGRRDNVGDWSLIEATGFIASNFSMRSERSRL